MTNRTADTAFAPSLALFAQLLADENIITRVDATARTASFEPVNRLLTLPSWKDLPEAVWLFLVAHEVGHARYTPKNAFDHPTLVRLANQYGQRQAHTVANLIEDVRIERLIRKQYPGLSGVFSRGYHALLSKMDFFKTGFPITPAVWAKLSSLDRINIYAKVGALAQVSLDPQSVEATIYNLALSANTFDEVMQITEQVMALLPRKRQRNPQQQGQSQQQGQQGDQSAASNEQGQEDGQGQSQQQGGQSSQDDAAQDGGDATSQGQSGSESDSDETPDAVGQQSGADNMEDSDQNMGGSPQTPDGVGSSHFDEQVDPFACDTQEAADQRLRSCASSDYYGPVMMPANTDYMHANDVLVDELLKTWRADAAVIALLSGLVQSARREQSTVLASMVSAFRANQAAWCARRVQTSKTGTVDPTRLASYKLTDDLFLRRQQRPEAQNHGFVVHVDWSSSMQYTLPVVLWQVLHLIWFAEQVNVPIEVWAFSDAGQSTPAYKARPMTSSRTDSRLIQLYSSRLRGADKLTAQSLLLSLSLSFAGLNYAGGPMYDYFSVSGLQDRLPKAMLGIVNAVHTHMASNGNLWQGVLNHMYLPLGGTPLYAGIVASVDTVRKFRKAYRLEQCISVWLTDGVDTQRVAVTDPATGKYDKPRLDGQSVLIDPRSGRTFKNDREQATWFEYHRTLTGATVVVVDISSTPLDTFSRVLTRTELNTVAARIMPKDGSASYRSGRRFGRRRRPVTVRSKGPKQSRKNLIFTSSDASFDDAGLAIITRQQFPSMGIDAYIVTHNEWWTNAAISRLSAAVDKTTKQIEESLKGDDENVPMSGMDKSRLTEALKSQHQTVAMRKFTGLLVPYMAAGRADGTV